jgi:hypothetical protein
MRKDKKRERGVLRRKEGKGIIIKEGNKQKEREKKKGRE